MADEEAVVWNVDLEVNLFHAMRRHKPVGVNRHFQMMCITDTLNNSIGKKISSKQIWDHLSEMYDLQALNESEILPFPNREVEFNLPGWADNLRDKDFPRMPEVMLISDDAPPPSSGRGKSKSANQGTASSTPASLAANEKAEDSPKREQRKRTRGQTSSPAVVEQSSKRPRRT